MKTRYFPTGSIIVRPKDVNNVEIGLYGDGQQGDQRCNAIGYRGKKTNPDFRYRFDSPAQREQYIAKFIEDCRKLDETRAISRQSQREAELNLAHNVQVGDVFYSSWGYDQTNIDFYRVTEVRGAFVIIRQLSEKRTYTGDMTGWTEPGDDLIGEPIRKKVLPGYGGDRVQLKLNSYSRAYPYDGKPKSWSSYA